MAAVFSASSLWALSECSGRSKSLLCRSCCSVPLRTAVKKLSTTSKAAAAFCLPLHAPCNTTTAVRHPLQQSKVAVTVPLYIYMVSTCFVKEDHVVEFVSFVHRGDSTPRLEVQGMPSMDLSCKILEGWCGRPHRDWHADAPTLFSLPSCKLST